MDSISTRDYLRVLRARGARSAFALFREVHLFDIQRRTDTAPRVQTAELEQDLSSINESVLYMASWTSVVRNSLSEIQRLLPPPPHPTSMVDVGCGKGKVLIIALSEFSGPRGFGNVVGVEHSTILSHIAEANLRKCGRNSHYSLVIGDAASSIWVPDSGAIGIYMYNPFSSRVLQSVLSRVVDRDVVIAYNNPVHEKSIDRAAWKPIHQSSGWHENQSVMYFASRAAYLRLTTMQEVG